MRDSLPDATDVLAGVPAPRTDGPALRAAVRALRAAGGRLLGVLDDDPTGSQAVHDVQVVTVPDVDACAAALNGAAATCFMLTNSRSLGEADAVALTVRAARALLAAAARTGAPADLVSRSDSTLRGHVLAEVAALAAVREQAAGRPPDAVLLVPAFLEAGRVTAGDIHWARSGGALIPVGETEFARDPVFGYASSDLRDFLAEKSGGAITGDRVASLSLTDIRGGGPGRVRDLLAALCSPRGTTPRDPRAGAGSGAWVVVNAVEYSDLETVAAGVLEAQQAGASLLFRSGPSFVRALSGLEPRPPLRGDQIAAGLAGGPGRGSGHGLVVAGSYTAQTSRQLAGLLERGGLAEVELDVRAVLAGRGDAAAAAARQVGSALARSDVLLRTSRRYVAAPGQDGLAAGRTVSAALVRVVREALAGPAGPAWLIAKGGITSHDLAVHALGIRRAEVLGQLFPGMVSVLRPLDAAPGAAGTLFVVFPGNVGGDDALADAVAILRGARLAGPPGPGVPS